MADKPSNVPEWATEEQIDPVSGQVNKVEPPTSYSDGGWSRREIPPRQYWNWMLWKIGQWITWVSAGTSSATGSTVMERDSGGRTKVADPVDDEDAVNKGFLGGAATQQYQETTVSLGGDFNSNQEVRISRIANQVTLQSNGDLTHSLSAAPFSSTGVIPSEFRPSVTVNNSYVVTGEAEITVSSGGTISAEYRNPDGTQYDRTDTISTMLITYLV